MLLQKHKDEEIFKFQSLSKFITIMNLRYICQEKGSTSVWCSNNQKKLGLTSSKLRLSWAYKLAYVTYLKQTFIKPTYLLINLKAKSKPRGQNGLIWNKDPNIISNWAFSDTDFHYSYPQLVLSLTQLIPNLI